jgi:hypothetical protein
MDAENKDGKGVLCYVYEDAGHPLPEKKKKRAASRVRRGRA